MEATVNTYRATVISTFYQGDVEHTTYIGARSTEEAKRKLEREGYNVVAMWVLDLAATVA